jgi:hypothetical protein
MSNDQHRPPTTSATGESFDEIVLPHLDAAYRLARWMMRNEHDAEDVVQEASLRAFRYFRTFTGGNGRAWFLRSFGTPVGAGVATVSTHQPTRSMRSNTAAPGHRPIPRRCCCRQMMSG